MLNKAGKLCRRLNATRQVTEMPSFRCDGDHTTAKNPNANSCSRVQPLQRTPAELSVRQMLRLRHTLLVHEHVRNAEQPQKSTACIRKHCMDKHNTKTESRLGKWLEYPLMVEFVAAYITLMLSFAFASCSTISPYDQTAYLQAVNTKVDALTLMAKAVDDYINHRTEVAEFMIELDKAYEYERGRPLNTDTIKQWDTLRDPNRDLLGGFLKEWKEDGKLLPVYVERKKAQIGTAFDQIIQLESGKIKSAS